jgi:tetratricopeptide (TPR) repeat protein
LLFLPAPIFAGLLAWFWLKREDWGRHALLGIGFFLINLVPVLAFIALKYRDMAWSLDHLIYLPSIGLCELVAAAGEGVRSRLPAKVRILAGVLAALVLLGLAWESHRYAAKFVDQKTLWTYALRYNSDAGARNNLGDALQREGRMAEAILQYREALRAKPGYAEAHNNLANALLALGQFPEAQAEYEEALRLKSTYAEPHNGLGNILTLTGKMDAAGPQYAEALELKPDYPEALNGLGNVLLHAGRIPEAEAKFEQALELNPDYAEAHCNLGLVFVQTGRLPEAIAQFEIAQRLKPNDARIARVLESLRAAPK